MAESGSQEKEKNKINMSALSAGTSRLTLNFTKAQRGRHPEAVLHTSRDRCGLKACVPY